jgi:2,4-dihydroxyhept-2-ene-1,7-dioic acid aldolase
MTGPRTSRFRAALARPGGPALGTWVKLPATESVELLALAGFDFVVIDLEHAPLDLETTYRLVGTAAHLGMAPIVRVPALDGGIAQRVLDAGAEGIMLPHVDTVEQAEAVYRIMVTNPWIVGLGGLALSIGSMVATRAIDPDK